MHSLPLSGGEVTVPDAAEPGNRDLHVEWSRPGVRGRAPFAHPVSGKPDLGCILVVPQSLCCIQHKGMVHLTDLSDELLFLILFVPTATVK